MHTIAQNKHKKISNAKIKACLSRKAAAAEPPSKMIPGKSLEQIRIEAVRQLREIGVLA
ncbi:MAG: hypothetical protein WCX69_00570 [Candidatus Paceibacterota bacterium]